MKKILLTTTALKQPWKRGDWDMTDGNTHAINQHLDEREDWDALQEVTAELEQAEARIEELEAKLERAEGLLVDAMVQLENGKIKTRRNRAYLIGKFLAELKGETDE